MKKLKMIFCSLAALLVSNLALGDWPTLDLAVKYAKSVVLVKRVVKDDRVHSYVKEVWRSDPLADSPPPVGSEYGRPAPYRPSMKFPERDAIVFDFGAHPPEGCPNFWTTPVTEKKRVPLFLEEVPVVDDAGLVKRMTEEPMHVDDVRSVVRRANPKKEATSR